MSRTIALSAAVTVLAICALMAFAQTSPRAGDDTPPVFDTRPYSEARKAAESANKWFIVKATAVWCGPCKQMDKTTWRDAKVVSWIETNAIAVALDVDREPQVAADLGIEAMPTMIAFKDGQEFDRVVGYKSPADFLAWLEGLARGERSIEAIRRRAATAPDRPADIRARLDLARSLVERGEHAQAADEYLWLWRNMLEHQPSMYGVRLSFMAGDMQRLARRDPEARKRFIALRDETGRRLENDKVDPDDLVDWVVLNNRVLDDQAATLAWYERVKDERRWRPMVDRVSRDLTEMFISMKRWAEVGRLAKDPLADLDQEIEFLRHAARIRLPEGMGDEQRKIMEETPKRLFREKVARVHAGLLAAGRDDVALKYARRALKADASAAMARELVATALDAEQPRADHIEWLAAHPDPENDRLRTRLAEALDRHKDRKK